MSEKIKTEETRSPQSSSEDMHRAIDTGIVKIRVSDSENWVPPGKELKRIFKHAFHEHLKVIGD